MTRAPSVPGDLMRNLRLKLHRCRLLFRALRDPGFWLAMRSAR